MLALYPAANLGTAYTFGFTSPILDNFGQGRLDHTFSASDSMFIRFTVDHAEQTYYSQPFPQFTDIPASQNYYVTLGETHIFSPSLLNTARFSWAGTRLATGGPLPFTGPQFSFVTGQALGQINVAGLGQFDVAFIVFYIALLFDELGTGILELHLVLAFVELEIFQRIQRLVFRLIVLCISFKV